MSYVVKALLILLGVCVIRLIGDAIYKIYFHPLAKYPGPFLAKLTDCYAAYHALTGGMFLDITRCHEKYGEFVRYAPNRILVNDAQALRDIYNSNQVKKSKAYDPVNPVPGAVSLLTTIEKSEHRHKRKIMSQGLSDNVLRRFEPTLLPHIDLFIKKLCEGSKGAYDGWSEARNMTDRCNYLTFDIMGVFVFGNCFQAQERDDNRFLIDAIALSKKRSSVYAQVPGLAKLQLEKIFYPRGSALRERFLRQAKEFAEARMNAEKNAKEDLFSFVVDAKDPETGTGFTMKELWSESRLLMVAAYDTMSTALAASMFYLSWYPECYEKLSHEIRTTFASASEIHSGPKMASCHYLRAVVDEAMRMSPSATAALWREVEPDGAIIGGRFVPGGVDVATNIYTIHHNEKYFPDSYTFKPERWLHDELYVEQDRGAFNPFSLGTRNCIGRGFAMMEIYDTIAHLMWRTDFRRPEGALGMVGAGTPDARGGRHRVKEFQLTDHLIGMGNGPYLQFTPRRF